MFYVIVLDSIKGLDTAHLTYIMYSRVQKIKLTEEQS